MPCISNPCQNNGSCINLFNQTSQEFDDRSCACTAEFTGAACETSTPCSSNPCQNDAVCSDVFDPSNTDFDSHTCACTAEFTGTDCETPTPCSLDPCQNNGTCSDVFDPTNTDLDTHYCVCTENFTGTECETSTPCSSNPCENDGSCTNVFNDLTNTDFDTHSCACTAEYTGANCETSTPCSSNPCVNGGTCTDVFNDPTNSEFDSHSCSCTTEYIGSNCETPTPCTENPCENDGECTNIFDFDTRTCACTFDYTGPSCETSVPCEDYTDTPPCHNGTCTNSLDFSDYTCDCDQLDLYTGVSCNTTIPCQVPNACLNSGVCENSEDYSSHTCTCQPFFGGTDCLMSMTPFRTSFSAVFVMGDPHYYTFDGPKVDPQGTCAYTATKLCVNDTTSLEGSKILVDTETLSGLVTVEKHLPFFEIVADHNWSPSAHGYPTVTVLHGIEVFYRLPSLNKGNEISEYEDFTDIYDLDSSYSGDSDYPDSDLYHFRIHQTLAKARKIHLSVNGNDMIKLRPGENFESQGIATRIVGEFHVIYLGVGFQSDDKTWLENTATKIDDYILKVRYRFRGPHGQLYLEASELLQTKVCGIFGNWNGENDVELPDNVDKQEHERLLMEEFSFPEADVEMTFDFVDRDFNCDEEIVYAVCSDEDDMYFRAICEEINSAPFEHCDRDKEGLIDACVFDLCAGMDEDETICDMFESYVTMCNQNGASQNFIVDWREPRCPLICGENQVYNSCGKSACQATTNYCTVDANTCADSVECTDGCYCAEGFLLNEDGNCVESGCTESTDIERIIFEATLCYECVEVKTGQWSAFNGTECVTDDIYGQCKIFTTQDSCENCGVIGENESINSNTCGLVISDSWFTDMSQITNIYHSDDFSGAVYTDSRDGSEIDEETYEHYDSVTNETITEFSHAPEKAIDGSISKAMQSVKSNSNDSYYIILKP